MRIYNKKDFKEKIKPFIDQENGKIQEKKKINSLTTKKIGSLKILPFFFLINSHLRGGGGGDTALVGYLLRIFNQKQVIFSSISA